MENNINDPLEPKDPTNGEEENTVNEALDEGANADLPCKPKNDNHGEVSEPLRDNAFLAFCETANADIPCEMQEPAEDEREKCRELEKKIKNDIKRGQMINMVIFSAFSVLGLIFAMLYLESRTVELVDAVIKYEVVSYNSSYIWGIAVGFIGALISGILLGVNFALCRLDAFDVGDDRVALLRGMTKIALYINGDEADKIWGSYYLEGKLRDGSSATVTFSRMYIRAHISFSNGHDSIDL